MLGPTRVRFACRENQKDCTVSLCTAEGARSGARWFCLVLIPCSRSHRIMPPKKDKTNQGGCAEEKENSGPSGWAKHNKERTKKRRLARRLMVTGSLTQQNPRRQMKKGPATCSVGTQTDGDRVPYTTQSTQTDGDGVPDKTQRMLRDVCVGEHVSGEPILWKGIFDLP